MSLRRLLASLLAVGLGVSLVAPDAWAKKKPDPDEEETSEDEPADDSADASTGDDEGGGDEGDDGGGGGEDKPAKKKKKKDEPFVKQNLSGHDMGTSKKANVFEKDRFFVDKVDTEKTSKGTLVQGSLSSSSFAFTESGGSYGMNLGDNSAKFSRFFTELRLQTDFRHISAGRWDARIDARARVVNTPPDGATSADPTRVQSGFNGTNEYDIRELWLFRSGKRSDIFFGRQFVPDLGGVKFDGLRVDYASSNKVTLIGFGGLYPLRGSRSLTTDYQPLKTNEGNSAGRLVGAGGFGGAYRTINAYGAVGGVALVPLAGEQPRIFVTSTGYWRNGATLDLYHFGLVDLYGSQKAGLTNASVGANYKPGPRLRLTGSFNRVDVDTLAVQANAFLTVAEDAGVGNTIVQNETYFRRLATNTARGGVSAGLGQFQRFEISTALSYRWRPAVAIPTGVNGPAKDLQANRGVEVFGSIVDRRSFKNLRLGVDVLRTIGIGSVAYQRSTVFSMRAFASRELANGHGEWEAEVSYTTTRDSADGFDCSRINRCYGSSVGTIIGAGGNLYYRINRDWFGIGTLFLSRQTLSYGATAIQDPTVTGLMGYFRIAYRF